MQLLVALYICFQHWEFSLHYASPQAFSQLFTFFTPKHVINSLLHRDSSLKACVKLEVETEEDVIENFLMYNLQLSRDDLRREADIHHPSASDYVPSLLEHNASHFNWPPWKLQKPRLPVLCEPPILLSDAPHDWCVQTLWLAHSTTHFVRNSIEHVPSWHMNCVPGHSWNFAIRTRSHVLRDLASTVRKGAFRTTMPWWLWLNNIDIVTETDLWYMACFHLVSFKNYWSFWSFKMSSILAWVSIILTNCTCAYEKVSQAILHRLLAGHACHLGTLERWLHSRACPSYKRYKMESRLHWLT